jgi:PAS domain S-box-containing protein
MKSQREDPRDALARIFPGDSEMARRMRAFDWSRSDLGPPSSWHENLRTAVSICLTSRFPIILWWGPDFTVLYNDGYASILGPGKHPQFIGRPGRELWSEIWDTIGPMLTGVMQSGEATWSEEMLLFLNRRVPREECYFTFSYSPILTGDASNVGGIFCAVTETTDYVLARRRAGTLRELGQQLAGLDRADDALQRAAAVLAENPQDVPIAALYRVDRTRDDASLVAAVRDESRALFPTTVRLDDGSAWPLGAAWTSRLAVEARVPATEHAPSGGAWPESPQQASVLPIAVPGFDGAGAVLVAGVSPRLRLDAAYRDFFGSIAAQIGTSMSEAHAYEAERERAESLAELDRAKTTFFSNVSHEFRTPLTLMLGPLEDVLYERDEALGPRAAESLELAHRNALRLLKLVNTLLDFSRIEAGRIEAVYEETDLAAFTEELASVFRSAFERAGLSFDVACRKISAPIFVDRDMWEKVLLNLLSNAFKFTLEGGVSVRLHDAGERAVVEVRDSGIGIPVEELPHVFERFHRVNGARGRTHEGTGIGLALVQELVKLHGGTVAVESEVGAGTVFTVSIPTGSAHLPPQRLNAARTRESTALGAAPYVDEALRWLPDAVDAPLVDSVVPPSMRVSTAGARVLVADDNQDLRDYLRRLLSPHWAVEVVADGEAALERALASPPDLVLADVMMPKRDGFGLLRALRESPSTRTLPVILLSARAGEEARVEGLDAGADDYLTKPFSARELLARVNAHLELARVRREAEQELRASEERFRGFADTAPAMLWVADPSGGCTFLSRAWYAFTGQAEEAALGRGWLEAVHPEDRDTADASFLAAEARQEPFAIDYRLRRADGVYRWAIDAGAPHFDTEGNFIGYVGSVFDIDARKRAEAEREELLGVAERANRAKDEFLAVLSHELRSPMNAMLGWVRLLELERADPEFVLRAAETLKRNIDVQSQVINDLLDVSRIVSGRFEIESGRLNLEELVRHCVDSQQPSAQGRRIDLQLELVPGAVAVSGDPVRLQQAVANLLGNALKFTPAGGSVRVSVGRADGRARLCIEDSGVGIAPDVVPRLFERFWQAESSTTRRHGGLGIGLSIVKTIVELHGGEVHAESEGIGRGARFVVTLPLADADEPSVARTLSVERPQAGGEVPPTLEILLVDDDEDTRDALSLVLGRRNRVRAVASVAEALEAYRTRRPDVLISDIGMPDQDGYALIRAIRDLEEGRSGRTFALAMTGFAGHRDHEMALRAGFDDHVAKPVDSAVLIERVRALAASGVGQ